VDIHPDIERVIMPQEEIQARVSELAAQISADYADNGQLVVVGILKGAFIFLSDLTRRLTVPHRVDFMALSSYGQTTTSGAVRIIMDLRVNVEARHVLVVEDIVDTGYTLHYLLNVLRTRNPASLRSCVLLSKPDRRQVDVPMDYVGFEIPDVWVVGYVDHVLIDRKRVQARVAELAAEISRDYAGMDGLLLVCVLKGAVMFLSDLSRQLTIPHAIDFMAVSSYGASTESSGIVRILMDLETSIMDRHVLVVEDIVDSGRTLDYITRNLGTRGPASLKICTLLDKKERRVLPIPVDYVGFEIPDEFVIGYGLDFAELYRNLPFIGVLKPEFYE
jgi:hypoxanthine phosphoribosyltransferase